MADENASSNTTEPAVKRDLPIQYYGEDLIGIFADQAMVSHGTGMFTMLFFQMQVPPIVDVAVLQQIEQIPARCVAKVILTPDSMEQLLAAIETNIARYKERLALLQNMETEK